jgi:hypothetical protein
MLDRLYPYAYTVVLVAAVVVVTLDLFIWRP